VNINELDGLVDIDLLPLGSAGKLAFGNDQADATAG
jgi:hypothetical protein